MFRNYSSPITVSLTATDDSPDWQLTATPSFDNLNKSNSWIFGKVYSPNDIGGISKPRYLKKIFLYIKAIYDFFMEKVV